MFTHDPGDDAQHCFEIVRARPNHPLKMTVATRDYLGLWTHWWNGKTICCPGALGCEACEENVKRVWFGHFIARRHEDDRYVLSVWTQPCRKLIESKRRSETGLLGLRVMLARAGRRPTSPVIVTCGKFETGGREFEEKTLVKVLMRLYADNANEQNARFD